MEKGRSSAFFDAVLAIIMTILVLELERPEVVTWASLWSLRMSFFSYAVSFFWLGTMWINIHNEWEHIEEVSIHTMWNQLLLLFVSSFFPYVTSLVASDFYNSVSQVLYGIVVILVTICFLCMFRSVEKDNAGSSAYQEYRSRLQSYMKWMKYDIAVKLLGIVLSATVFPPMMMISVLGTLLVLVIPDQFLRKI